MFDFNYLEDINRFYEGVELPHSDHESDVEKKSLNGLWNIKVYDNPSKVPLSLINGDTNGVNFDYISVPSHIQMEGFDTPQYVNTQYPWDGKELLIPPKIPQLDNKVAVYKKSFVLEKSQLKKKIFLNFEGVESSLALFINGVFIGYKEDSFTPSHFLIDGKIREGENEILALVTHYCSGSWFEDQDFWRFSGIFRSVDLVFHENSYIEDIKVESKVSEDLSTGELDVTVKIRGKGEIEYFLEKKKVSLPYTLEDVELWSSENPKLYNFEINLKVEGKIIEKCKVKVGFRKIEIKNGILRINGKPLIFYGVNRHEFFSTKGRALNEEDIYKDLMVIKKNNFNSIRCSHYPNQSCFYRMCDEIGLYVIDETNIETHGTWEFSSEEKRRENAYPGCHEEYLPMLIQRAKSMYERDKNHPCIVSWSCGNESYDGSVILEISKYFKKMDSTRFVHYESVSFDSPYSEISDVESQMYTKPGDIAKFLLSHKEKPFMLCEYSHSMGNSTGGLTLYSELEKKFPNYQGGFIWDYRDQNLNLDGKSFLRSGMDFKYPTDYDFCSNGLLYGDSFKSDKLNAVKAEFSRIVFSLTDEGILIENKYSFRSTEDITIRRRIDLEGETVYKDFLNKSIDACSSYLWSFNKVMKEGTQILYIWAFDLRNDYEISRKSFVIEEKPFLNRGHLLTNIITGNRNFGCVINDSQVLINTLTGMPDAICDKERNILHGSMKIETWRAPNNNEMANASTFRWMDFKIASMYQKAISCNYKDGKIRSQIQLGKFVLFENICFYDDGSFDLELEPFEIESDLPCFGITFPLDKKYDRIHYLGNINGEAYADRKQACVIGYAEENVASQMRPYIKPQECANKTDLRFLEILDEEGHGLRITSSTFFEASVLKNNPHEIEDARHIDDLAFHEYNTVRILHGSCGVGGDDSWGAPCHKRFLYHLPKEKWIVNIKII